ncbi:hypothetical protein [Streptomyces sp. NPDC059786]|uniref:hypothetical protein n=1 Tax=Streptomyces sp. NPDC059786 TaxID=3346946 RepID=UPI00366A06A9
MGHDDENEPGQPGEQPPAFETVVTRADRELAAGHWLLAAADDAEAARRDWQTQGAARIRVGVLFAAVRVPAARINAAVGVCGAGTGGPTQPVVRYLAATLHGPVIYSSALECYFILTVASAAQNWRFPGAGCVPAGVYLDVPPPAATVPQGGRPWWVVPMHSAGDLCNPLDVAAVCAAGHRALNPREQTDDG